MVDPAHTGKVFPPFSYTVERGKVHEFLLAIGDDNPAYEVDDPPLPPTFPITFTFWGGLKMQDALQELDIEIRNVLHTEQEYEYLAPIHVGDTVTGELRVANIYTRGGLDFMELATAYENQDGEAVLRERALIIVRGEEEGA
jgi:hypothetical protein